jgi:hypothetical protein
MSMDFSALFDWLQTPIIVVEEDTAGAYNDEGIWVGGTPVEQTELGIVLPFSTDDLDNAPEGQFSVLDRKLYLRRSLKLGQKVKVEGQMYTVQQGKDYAAQAGFCQYYLKRVSVDD